MRGDNAVDLDEPLGMLSGLESPHASLPFTCGLMRVLRSIAQVPVLPMGDAGHDHTLRPVAPQFVRHDYAPMAMASGPNSLRKKRMAARRSRLGCTRMSMTTTL